MSASTAVGPPLERGGASRAESGESARVAMGDDRHSIRPTAVIVCHGMGQQVEFETLNSVARAIWREHSRDSFDSAPVRVRYVAFDDVWLARVELELDTRDGARTVHLYEAYWAPITEGRTPLSRVITFLVRAGVRGVRYVMHGSFDRWIFGARQVFPLRRRLLLPLGAALLVIATGAAAAAAYGVFALRVVARLALAAPLPGALEIAALLAGAVACLLLRRFLVQAVGDVAAYISAHEASRFAEIRRAIQAVARRVARNVYASRVPGQADLEYGDVIVVGHSLGSVIAYDMLNDAINRDLALASTPGAAGLDVVARTALLLTLGSPLDKTAFLFRTQQRDAPVRETLAAAVQPMITGYANRPHRWINIWSPRDWVSGSLEYYDADPVPHAFAALAVENVRDSDAPVRPVRAHQGYFERREAGRRLYEAIVRAGAPRAAVSGDA